MCGQLQHLCTRFLIDAKYSLPVNTDLFPHDCTVQQTHISRQGKPTTCSLQDVTLIQYPHSFHVKCVIHKSLLFPLPDVPTLMPWIISDPEHHQPTVHLVTHTHQQVAISSTSRHTTMTKNQQASRLLWLPRLTG